MHPHFVAEARPARRRILEIRRAETTASAEWSDECRARHRSPRAPRESASKPASSRYRPRKCELMTAPLSPRRFHAALDFGHGAVDVLRREHRQAGKSIRVAPARLGETVVREPRKRRALVRFQHLHPGRGQQQQLLVDAQLVHARDALLADVHELLLQVLQLREHARHAQRRIVGRIRALPAAGPAPQDLRNIPCLFGRDAHVGRVAVDCPSLRREARNVAIAVACVWFRMGSSRAQRFRHRQPRGPKGGKESAEQADEAGPDDTGDDQRAGDRELKHDFANAPPSVLTLCPLKKSHANEAPMMPPTGRPAPARRCDRCAAD